ncbi:GAF domain-containing protein [Nostoc commune]|uniref:GAF domain-containing protein n=1 Tax=Nostoc commune TaxID=1178 RepID=UPI0018C7102D|nr:GAF domain-containing protein [Nostoc commune]MBG1262896.1 GAF domain-containing protein [Nostoc commune BAE]
MENSSTIQPIQPNSEQPESHSDVTSSLHQNDQQKALSGVIARIREFLDIETIFKITVTEVRELLKADRVTVYCFYPELGWEGEFIYEDVRAEWGSVLAAKLPDQCFAADFVELYQQGQIKAMADIYQPNVSDCHVQMLERFQVRANINVPLIKGKDLWGLLCIHQCSSPRQWEASEIEFVQLIAEHLGVALQQTDYLEQVKLQSAQLAQATEKAAEWQKTIARTIEKVRQSLDLQRIFRTSTSELRQVLNADRVAIYRFNADWSGEFVFESVAEGWTYLMQEQLLRPELDENISECSVKDLAALPIPDTYLQDTEGGRFAKCELYRVCNDIYSAGFSDCYISVLESYEAKAYVILAIYHSQKLWGLLAVYQNTKTRDWQEDEIYLLTQVGVQLGVALQQAEFLRQTQIQAAEISKAAERQRALANTVEKIRQSLDIDIIFNTTTQEVLQLLEAERVAIYRFSPDGSSEFVADSIVDGWMPMLKSQPITERILMQEKQASKKKYARNEVFVPISQGEKLWGLLVAYQNSQPRYWQDEEINLLAQVGVQLGVALQQAESLKQVQVQAQKLAKAAERERKAAQREKALAATVEKIRQSLDIDTIFATSTEEVRRLLEVDRVTIYQFRADWSGEFVAESLAQGWTPVSKIVPAIAGNYLQETQGGDFAHGKTLVIKDSYSPDYSIPYIALIELMEAMAYMIVPIFQGEKLWGLLAAYQNIKPRDWQEDEVDLLMQIGTQLGVGLQQAELLEQTQRQKEEITLTLKQLQNTQSQLVQSEKMAGLGQLVAGVAHEINNPISFIYGNMTYVTEHTENLFKLLHLYQKQYPITTGEIQKQAAALDLDFISDDLPKILTSMKMGADRISQLVLSLRSFSRLDEVGMKPVDLHEGIESTLLILQHRLKPETNSFAIEVIKEYGELPPVVCYAAQINQVFMNIFNNAIDALEHSDNARKIIDNPKIWIHTEAKEGNTILICIADNGCGIPVVMRSRIFEPFFTTKQPGQGIGLGLSISYQIIVEKHGGNIKCVSEPDKGCELWIEIPIKPLVS